MTAIERRTTSGAVRGELEGGVAVFKGIPFAEPPFGANLFRPPVPRAPWTDVRDCTDDGPCCPQPSSGVFGGLDDHCGEDCLSVNVWAPEDAIGLPVMFWIHGGGFTMGSHADSGAALARAGVVFVACNYRLGALGFLHAGHLDDAYAAASGAYGLADQLAALRWVHDNVAVFGGDPDNVTIFGCSAGATFVDEFLGVPSARGLFRRAISQSAPIGPLHGFPATTAAPIAEAFLAELGVAATALPTVPTARILETQAVIARRLRRAELPGCGRVSLPFVPLTGGDLLPRPAFDAVAEGAAADVALILGSNRDECTLYELMAEVLGTDEDVAPQPWRADPALQERIREVYRRHRDPGSPIAARTSTDTDRIFRVPALRLAEAHHRGGGSTRVYRFDWRSPTLDGRAGASHGTEVPFVLGDFTVPITTLLVGDDPPRAVEEAMRGAWVSFATSGDPAATGSVPDWPEYDPDTRETMVFDDTTTVVADPDGEQRACWDGVTLTG